MEVVIGPLEPSDWEAVRAILVEGILTRNATFETEAPDWEAWNVGHLENCRLVARTIDGVVGWASLSPVSGRCFYAGVAEVSVYVAENARGRGVGRTLLEALVEISEKNGIWTLQSGIFPENETSIALHLACGFRQVGVRERLGQMHGHWRDVVLLERRSPTIGT